MRESPFLWWAFFYMALQSRIWWAFLTGTAMEYRELPFLPYGRSGYSFILMLSINGPFVHHVTSITLLSKLSSLDRKFVIFEGARKGDDLVTPKK